MSLQFHSLKVSNTKQETEDAISISFEVPKELKTSYTYQPGQYLTLKAIVNGEELRREYSLCSSPSTDEQLTVTAKRVENGKVSNFLNDQIKEGDSLEVMTPAGSFTLTTNPSHKKHYFLFAGGSGITPIISILVSALKEEQESNVTLVFQNSSEKDIIFKQKLEDLSDKYGGRLKLIHILSAHEGRLDKEKTIQLIKENLQPTENFEFYMCGPSGMMEVITDTLKNMGAPQDKIHRELFTAPSKPTQSVEHTTSALIETQMVTIKLSNRDHEVEVTPDSTVLFSALDQDIDPPYSCQSGICSTCRAKLISGQVVMDEREGLTEKEIEEGYVLTCQAHPLTSDVILEFE